MNPLSCLLPDIACCDLAITGASTSPQGSLPLLQRLTLEQRCYALGAVYPFRFACVMKRPWTFQILLPLVMLILLAVSCDRILRNLRSNPEEPTLQPVGDATPTSEQSSSPTNNSTVLIDDETEIQITLPESWVENPNLHDSAELQAADTANELYVIVVAEESPALMRLGLQDNAARYRALLKDQMAAHEAENPTEVAFINDDFAAQYEIRGSLEGDIPIVYLHTTVVTQQRYYQIVAWTSPQQYDAYRSELQAITATFQEIDS